MVVGIYDVSNFSLTISLLCILPFAFLIFNTKCAIFFNLFYMCSKKSRTPMRFKRWDLWGIFIKPTYSYISIHKIQTVICRLSWSWWINPDWWINIYYHVLHFHGCSVIADAYRTSRKRKTGLCVINMHSRVLYFLVWSVIAKAYWTGRKRMRHLMSLLFLYGFTYFDMKIEECHWFFTPSILFSRASIYCWSEVYHSQWAKPVQSMSKACTINLLAC